jgi:hypothetical protein
MSNPLSLQRYSFSNATCPLDIRVPIVVRQDLTQRLSLTVETCALLPSESLPVTELLSLCLPTLSGVMPSMDPQLCFSNHPLTESIGIYLSRPVPPAAFVEGLRTVAGQAMLDGKLSIVDWTCKNSTSFFSFELIKFWTELTRAIKARQVWAAAMKWLEQATEDQRLVQDVCEVHLMLQTAPWSASLRILCSRLTVLEMATFLSDGWLSSSQIDMALSSTALRQSTSGDSQVLHHYLIGTTILSEYLHSSPILHMKTSSHDNLPWQDYKVRAPQELQRAGEHLVQHQPDGEVLFVTYSPPGHWVAISVTSCGTLEWADPLGRRPPMKLVTGVRKWLDHHISASSFSLGNSFKCSHQTDSFLCGIIALNSIKHRIFGDTLWREEDRTRLCIQEFLNIMRMCQKFEGESVRF